MENQKFRVEIDNYSGVKIEAEYIDNADLTPEKRDWELKRFLESLGKIEGGARDVKERASQS